MRRATLFAAVLADYTVVKEQRMTDMPYQYQSTMLEVKIWLSTKLTKDIASTQCDKETQKETQNTRSVLRRSARTLCGMDAY